MKNLLLLILFVSGCCLCAAEKTLLKVADVFGSNMVLQRDSKVNVWGTAPAGAAVTVKFAGQSKTAKAEGNDGKWLVQLDPMKANAESQSMSISSGDKTVTFENVVVGDVWLCSGQSNMAWTVAKVNNADAEIAAAKFPLIRHSKGRGWQVCSPQTVKGFSAAAYFFGRDLFKALNVPIGLINCSVGGTPIEYWTATEDLLQVPYAKTLSDRFNNRPELVESFKVYQKKNADYRKAVGTWRKAVKKGDKGAKKPVAPTIEGLKHNEIPLFNLYFGEYPGNLYRRFIQPIEGYGLRGIIWYQGERNSKSAEQAMAYRDLLANMIKSWRKRLKQGELPFFYVQLPNYSSPTWPVMRESMLTCLKVPKTGMAIAIDVGEERNIHPRNKQAVGKRLSLLARKVAYGEDIVASGPIYESMICDGSKVVIKFKDTGTGLVAKDGKPLREFAIAGADKAFVPAQAVIDGKTVVVSSDKVSKPVAVRYAWKANPSVNLYNKEGLPASPFRTDAWPIK